MTLPCIDCLVLPICKSKYKELYNDPFSDYFKNDFSCEVKLAVECVLLEEFLVEHPPDNKVEMIIKNSTIFRNFIKS